VAETTYRIGGSVAPTACVRHPGAAVAFQCRECLDTLCASCRGPHGEACCRICHDALEALRTGAPAAAADRPRRSAWFGVIVGLAAVNGLLGAVWVGTLVLRPEAPPVDRSVADVATVSAVVERSRDAGGLVPVELGPLLDRLPPALAERVRSGAIRYQPAGDRRTFEVITTRD
jgi:hypothetical protein